MGHCFERSNKNSRREEYLQNELGCVGILFMPTLEVVVACSSFLKALGWDQMPGPLVCTKRADHSPQKGKKGTYPASPYAVQTDPYKENRQRV